MKKSKNNFLSFDENIDFDKNVDPYNRVLSARSPERPNTDEYIKALFTDFIELSGDRNFGNDKSIVAGIGMYKNIPVTVIGHRKGKSLEENMEYNFGMPNPEGYRKAERLMLQAEKFKRPIITFIDTPGAYPGLEAEQRGQGEAIAKCLYTMSSLNVPIISIIIGEGGSGGALAIGVSDYTIMLENSVFSVLSPEGFSTILWKDSSRVKEAAKVMKLTAFDLKELDIVDTIVKESENKVEWFLAIDNILSKVLPQLSSIKNIKNSRYYKIRKIGKTFI